MRYSNIKNSIANVICRFGARVDAMLLAGNSPQKHWHLSSCGRYVGKVFGTEFGVRNLVPVRAASEPGVSQWLPGSSESDAVTASRTLCDVSRFIR